MINLDKIKELQAQIKELQAQINAELMKLIDQDGKVSLYSFGNLFAEFKTVEDAELYAKHRFPNEDYYSICDNTYALAD